MKENTDIEDLKNRILQLEQEKKQLLKLISHDVKSPFNKLFALSNLLQLVSEDLNEEQLDYLTRMEWVIKEGLGVVRNLMDLRAIENDKIELSIDEVSVTSIISETIKTYTKQASAKKQYIETNLTNVTIQSDKRLLERVVDHLVSNAIKFTPKEGSILLKLVQSELTIEFIISSESGIIPTDEVNKLFMRNSPLSTRPTHGESALGNGLFIAQTYAQKLLGHISFNQKGSIIEFTLTLPVVFN